MMRRTSSFHNLSEMAAALPSSEEPANVHPSNVILLPQTNGKASWEVTENRTQILVRHSALIVFVRRQGVQKKREGVQGVHKKRKGAQK